MAFKVLVCGGRTFTDKSYIYDCLDKYHASYSFTVLIHGGARGADIIAGSWAESCNIKVLEVPAEWNNYGKAAGSIRNTKMLQYRPELVLAFPGGRGTEDMIDKAIKARVKVIRIPMKTYN